MPVTTRDQDEATLVAAVAAQRENAVALLDALLHAARDGEAAMQAIVAAAFAGLGCATETFEADLTALATHPEFSLLPELARLGTRGRPNVVATWADATAGPSLFAFAHIDSYQLDPDTWQADPYQVTRTGPTTATGYGIADDRSGVAGMVIAAQAIASLGLMPAGKVTFASCLGKHLGAGGTLAVMDRGYGGDAAVYLHPAETGGGLAEYKGMTLGLVQFQVSVPGLRPVFREQNQTPAAHRGLNAVHLAASIIADLIAWDADRGEMITAAPLEEAVGRSTNLHVTRITGGDDDRKTATGCTFSGMMTFPVGETVAGVRAALTAIVDASAARLGLAGAASPTITWLPMMANPASNADADPFAAIFAACVETVTGQRPTMWPAHTASDIRYPMLYAQAPTVGFGPRAGNFGGPDEWLDVDDFMRAITVLALLISRWCGLIDVQGVVQDD